MTSEADRHQPGRPRSAPFRTLAERLRTELAAGRWPVGSRLPPVSELARAHGLGVNTVRRAIEELATDGLIRIRQGSGAVVLATPTPAGPARSVGLITPTNRQRGIVIDSVENVLRSAGVNLLLACTDYEPAAELARAREFVAGGVDGLIIVPTIHLGDDPFAHLDSFGRLGVPYVFAERRPMNPPIQALCRHASFVCSDVATGVMAAIRHLVESGKRRIGFHGMSGTPHSGDVFAGYEEGLAAFGLAPPHEAVVHLEQWGDDDLAAYAELVAEQELDAVFSSSDLNAAMLLPHLRRSGHAVPDTLAVATFNDVVAATAQVPLTTVAPARAEVGAQAAHTVLRLINEGAQAPVSQTLIQPHLVVRESSAISRPAVSATS